MLRSGRFGAVSEVTGIASGFESEEIATTETLLLSEEVDLGGAVGRADSLDVDSLFTREGGVCEGTNALVGAEPQILRPGREAVRRYLR